MRIDRVNLRQAILSEGDLREFETIEWTRDNHLLLRDKDNRFWLMNPITGEVIARD
jgi:hypothetical protein